jgi:hypothetical protein
MSFAGPSSAKNAKRGKKGGRMVKYFEKEKNDRSEYARITKNSGEHFEVVVEGNKLAKCIIPGKFSKGYRFNVGEYILVEYETPTICTIIGKLSETGKKLAEKALCPDGTNVFAVGIDIDSDQDDDIMPSTESSNSDEETVKLEKTKIDDKKLEIKNKIDDKKLEMKDTKGKRGGPKIFSENSDAYIAKKSE